MIEWLLFVASLSPCPWYSAFTFKIWNEADANLTQFSLSLCAKMNYFFYYSFFSQMYTKCSYCSNTSSLENSEHELNVRVNVLKKINPQNLTLPFTI